MDDALDQYISDKKRERKERQSKIAEHQTAITAEQVAIGQLDRLIAKLEEASKLRLGDSVRGAPDGSEARPPSNKYGKGVSRKPEGAISQQWKHVLRQMCRGGIYSSLNEIIDFAVASGFEPTERAVRDRMREYHERGFVLINKAGRYAVTIDAAKRFDLRTS